MDLVSKSDNICYATGDEGLRESKEQTQVDGNALKERLSALSLSGHSDVTADDNSNYPSGSSWSKSAAIWKEGSKPNLDIDNSLLANNQIVISMLGQEDDSGGGDVGVPPALVSTPNRSGSPVNMGETEAPIPQILLAIGSGAAGRGGAAGLNSKSGASALNLSTSSSIPSSPTPYRPHSLATMDTPSPIPQMASTPIPVEKGVTKDSSQTKLGSVVSDIMPTPSTSLAVAPARPRTLSSVKQKKPASGFGSVEAIVETLVNDDRVNLDIVNTSFTSQTSTHTTTHESQTDLDLYNQLQVPILGYETMEERSRFTVFKLRVQKSADEAWHIFRRYSDFVRLNDVLKQVFPHFRLALPPKKWFGDNYDRCFLDDRLLGLQAFLSNIISHRDVCNSEPVREFLCVDDPPGAHDSLEESRAVCELLEDQVYSLRHDVATRDARIALLEEELSLYKAEVDNLRRALRVERALNTHRRHSPTSQQSESSITEHDGTCSEAEADQGRNKQRATSSVMTSPECASIYSWDAIPVNFKHGRHSSDKITTEAAMSAVSTSTLIPTLSALSLPPKMTVAISGMSSTVPASAPDLTSSLVPGITSVTPPMPSVSMNDLTPEKLCNSTTVP